MDTTRDQPGIVPMTCPHEGRPGDPCTTCTAGTFGQERGSTGYLIGRGLMAWAVAREVGCTPEAAHEALDEVIDGRSRVSARATCEAISEAIRRLS